MAITLDEVLQAYRNRFALFAQKRKAVESKRGKAQLAMLAAVLLIAWLARRAFVGSSPAWVVLLPLAAGAVLLWRYLELEGELSRFERLIAHTQQALARTEGQLQSGRTGEEFRNPEHLYERDLNVLGMDSLFGLMATVRTGLGERGLAGYLLDSSTGSDPVERFRENLRRQDAVQELAGKIELREEIALLGKSRFQQVPARFFDDWLSVEAPAISSVYRWALAGTAILLSGMLLVTLAGAVDKFAMLPNLLAVAAVQGLMAWRLRSSLKPTLEATAKISDQMQLVSEGLALMQRDRNHSEKLKSLRELVTTPDDAVKALAGLEHWVNFVKERDRGVMMVISLLLAGGTQSGIAIAKWKRKNATAMKTWLAAWAEFEALNAVATYAFEHPENVYPDLLPPTHAPVFEGVGIGHPLLPRAACVLNDIVLTPASRFYLISGSNMAGKSTLLRAIGLNAVLAYAGAPVRAASLRVSPLGIGTSLALTDSLAEAKSKFMAEVARLAAIVRLSEREPVVFLIDEVFSGTNSDDRKMAAGAVLQELLRNGAIGGLSTHDLALTSLADDGNHGLNVHMASPDESDPLAFDYRLKPGVNRSSNAAAILKMMGVLPAGPAPRGAVTS